MGVAHPVKTKTLQIAAERLGGRRQLRDYLRVPTEELVRWLSGAADPPAEVWLRALEVILDDLDSRGR